MARQASPVIDIKWQVPSPLLEEWCCLSRPTIQDGVVIAWRPLAWDASDRDFSISVSRRGILIGEYYLNEIPESIVETAWAAFDALKNGDEDSVLALVTHTRVRTGNHWEMVPVIKRLPEQRTSLDE